MKNILILCLFICLSGCEDGFFNTNPLETLTVDGFSLQAPSDWKSVKLQGFDSRVGKITNGKNELNYDLGWYSYKFQNETSDTHIRLNTKIDGRDALIVRPKKKGKGLIGVYIKIDDLNRLSLSGTSKNEKEILKIFESLKIL